MSTGKRSISRGYQLAQAAKPLKGEAAAASWPEYQYVNERLSALERLAGLLEQGLVTRDEFDAEKALIFRQSGDELLLQQSASGSVARPLPTSAIPGPSLLGRLFNWKLLPVGVAAGLALSFVTQPRETISFFDAALRLVGP